MSNNSKKSKKKTPYGNDEDWVLDLLNPSTLSPKTTKKRKKDDTPWPESNDKLYHPLPQSIKNLLSQEKKLYEAESKMERKLTFQEELELDRERRYKRLKEEGIEEPPIPFGKPFWEEHWAKIRKKRDYSNYLQRLKRKQKKEQIKHNIFVTSRKNARDYYLFQKRRAFHYTIHSLSKLFHFYRHSLQKAQRSEFLHLMLHLQEERYTLSLLYEDYLLTLNNKNRVRINTLLHENHFKKYFLMQLHQQQNQTHLSFLQKQQGERLLNFLWCLHHIKLLSHERKKLLKLQHPTSTTSFFHSNIYLHRPNTSARIPSTILSYQRPTSARIPSTILSYQRPTSARIQGVGLKSQTRTKTYGVLRFRNPI